MLRFEKDHPMAIIPTLATEGSCGFDLYANTICTIEPGQTTPVDTSIIVEIPKGYVGLITPRSGMAIKERVAAVLGTIDQDYRGRLRVMLENKTDQPYQVQSGQRIAQLVIVACLTEFETGRIGRNTQRGDKGFGSTGR